MSDKKTAQKGDKIGGFVVIGNAGTDPHLGLRLNVECTLCGKSYVRVATQLRHAARVRASMGATGPFCFTCAHLQRRRDPIKRDA